MVVASQSNRKAGAGVQRGQSTSSVVCRTGLGRIEGKNATLNHGRVLSSGFFPPPKRQFGRAGPCGLAYRGKGPACPKAPTHGPPIQGRSHATDTKKPRLGGMSAFPNGTPIPTPDLRRHGHICAIFDACQAPSLTEPCCLRIFQRLRSLMANSFANWVTTALIGFPSPNNSSAFTLIRLCLASVSILFILGM